MKYVRLSRQERSIEKALLNGEYIDVGHPELQRIAQAITRRRKEAVLHIRINEQDLKGLKQKAKHLGVKYQSFISEILHRFAA